MTTQMASEPFEFQSRLNLTLLTGLKARDLAELLENLRTVPGSVIYFHTHHFLVQHQYLSPEPPNDFAYWVTNNLLEQRLGEELAAVDILRFQTIHKLREEIIHVIENYLERNPEVRPAPPGMEFYFKRSVSFVIKTGLVAHNLREFRDAMEHISLSSISFHMFDARLRLERGDNDFSSWLDKKLGQKELAATLRKLDPYTQTEDGVRRAIAGMLNAAVRE
jgi:Family of unknown function (DUF5752)